MKMLVVLLLAVALGCQDVFGLEASLAHNIWEKFKLTHEKTYETKELESYRFGVFQRHLDTIEKHNENYAKGVYTFKLGVNQFADMEVEEFRKIMLGTRLNMSHSKHGEASAGRFIRLPTSVKVPDETDWRSEGAVTPVKNQGQCGSCWSFSTTGALEAAHFRLTNELVSLSEQQLIDCSGKYHNEGCNGGFMDNAFQYIIDNKGLDTEVSYPYHAKKEKCHFNTKSIGSTCSGFVDIEPGNEEALREAVATVGPVSIAIDVTEDKFMLYKEGVFVDETCMNDGDHLNHGVLVVGFGTEDNQDYWIVKNSWGPTWGEEGYIRMARNHGNMCGIATSASYPLVKKTNN